jgi:hypothetical protein
MVTPPPRRRRPPKVDTERAEAMRACAFHLKDLHRAQKHTPGNAQVSTRGLPKFVSPILELSYCTSPAALCAELAEPIKVAPLTVGLAEPISAVAPVADLEEEFAR